MAFSTLLRRVTASVVPFAIQRAKATNPSPIGYASRCGLLKSNFSTSSAAVSTSEDLDADSNLSIILKSLIESAKNETHDSLEIPAGYPFKIEDNAKEKTVSLNRKYQTEVIKVLADIPDHVANEDEDVKADIEDGLDTTSIPLVVSITKENGLCLEFGVTAYPDEISIDYMSTKNPNVSEDQFPYEGPDFTDLDENLQKAFHKYLDVRGIKPRVTNFLIEYMKAKNAKEYLGWLKTLQKFHQ